jgi:diguanylate cyclase (GGDEF)-like protein
MEEMKQKQKNSQAFRNVLGGLKRDEQQSPVIVNLQKRIEELEKEKAALLRKLSDAEGTIEKLHFDSISGLGNQALFEKDIRRFTEDAIKERKQYNSESKDFAFLFMDINKFKKYNDTYGHDIGDKTIAEVGNAIRSSIRQDIDFGFRPHGDEFIVILHASDVKVVEKTINTIHENVSKIAFSAKNIHSGEEESVSVGVSIGYALFETVYSKAKDPSKVVETAMKLADENMYIDKEKGRSMPQ